MLNIALPKGRLGEKVYAMFARAGFPCPGILEENRKLVFENEEAGQRSYNFHTANKGKASDCIACGQCEGACPQRINIIERLKDCAEAFDH